MLNIKSQYLGEKMLHISRCLELYIKDVVIWYFYCNEESSKYTIKNGRKNE
ncbi:MAG: hypothetical protein DHS20C13_12070 [Thermodesulfobacteriota bacterium]|nr:MAG: hypothetical protein DHS20C13_12070 [Thermodesulfobacteriota bacterium]